MNYVLLFSLCVSLLASACSEVAPKAQAAEAPQGPIVFVVTATNISNGLCTADYRPLHGDRVTTFSTTTFDNVLVIEHGRFNLKPCAELVRNEHFMFPRGFVSVGR